MTFRKTKPRICNSWVKEEMTSLIKTKCSRYRKVYVVIRSPIIAEAICQVVDQMPDFTSVGQSHGLDEAITSMAESRPDLILLGANADGFSPAILARRIGDIFGYQIPIVVVTTEAGHDPVLVSQAVSSDIAAYVSMDIDGDSLHKILCLVDKGFRVFGQDAFAIVRCALEQVPTTHLSSDQEKSLTPREQQVLSLMILGLGNREISDRLGIGLRTVEMHVSHIINKLGVHSRTEAVIRSLKPGPPDFEIDKIAE